MWALVQTLPVKTREIARSPIFLSVAILAREFLASRVGFDSEVGGRDT